MLQDLLRWLVLHVNQMIDCPALIRCPAALFVTSQYHLYLYWTWNWIKNNANNHITDVWKHLNGWLFEYISLGCCSFIGNWILALPAQLHPIPARGYLDATILHTGMYFSLIFVSQDFHMHEMLVHEINNTILSMLIVAVDRWSMARQEML